MGSSSTLVATGLNSGPASMTTRRAFPADDVDQAGGGDRRRVDVGRRVEALHEAHGAAAGVKLRQDARVGLQEVQPALVEQGDGTYGVSRS